MADVRSTTRASSYRPRRSRFWWYIGALAVVDVVIFVAAFASWSSYHAKPGGPSVMPVGTLLAFFVGVVLVIGLSLLSLGRRHRHR